MVKTPPFHGGNTGSKPVRVTIFNFNTQIGGLAQLGERLPCTQEVSGSIPLGSTNHIIKDPGGVAQLARAYGSYP